MVSEKGKKGALGYVQLLNGNQKYAFKDKKVQECVITKDSLRKLYKTKDINSYVSFLEKQY